MSNWPNERATAAASRSFDMKPPGEIARRTDITRLRPTDMRSIRPPPRRSSVTKAMPALRAARMVSRSDGLAVELDGAGPAAGEAGAVERAEKLGATGAHHAGEADDLAFMDVEVEA